VWCWVWVKNRVIIVKRTGIKHGVVCRREMFAYYCHALCIWRPALLIIIKCMEFVVNIEVENFSLCKGCLAISGYYQK